MLVSVLILLIQMHFPYKCRVGIENFEKRIHCIFEMFKNVRTCTLSNCTLKISSFDSEIKKLLPSQKLNHFMARVLPVRAGPCRVDSKVELITVCTQKGSRYIYFSRNYTACHVISLAVYHIINI